MAEDCLFCRIASGDMDAKIVHEDDRCVAFEDIHPQGTCQTDASNQGSQYSQDEEHDNQHLNILFDGIQCKVSCFHQIDFEPLVF